MAMPAAAGEAIKDANLAVVVGTENDNSMRSVP